jgi:hypothetical protein
MASTSRPLIRIFLVLTLVAAGAQAVALIAEGDFTGGTPAGEGWDSAAAAKLGAADLWSQVGAILNGAAARQALPAMAPNIWDTTSAFIAAAPRQVTMSGPGANGNLEVAREPPAPILPAVHFAPPLIVAQAAQYAAAGSAPPPADSGGIVIEGDSGAPPPAPVPLPASLWLFAAALSLLRLARR